jgi:macrolide-specific efflux system membrane fusion protein
MRKKVWIGIIIIIVIGFVGWLIFRPQDGSKAANTDSLYDFSQAQRMDLSEKVDATGTVTLSKNSDIYPAFEATVKQIICKAGSYVKKGQLLVLLDSPTMAESLADALDSVNQAQINLATAKRDLSNTKALFDVQGATLNQVQDAQDKVDTYQQQLNSAKIKLDNLMQRPDDANFIAPNHREILIKAPFDGTVAWVNVVAGARVTTSNSILSITANNAIEIEAKVDESEIQGIQSGQKALITTSDPNEPELQGVVSEVGTIGTTESGVVNFPVRIRVPGGDGVLRSGMSVDVTVVIQDRPNVMAIPVSAVVTRRGKSMVAVKQADGVRYVRVETGVRVDTNIEILSGLNPGDTIAIEKPKLNTQKPGNNNRPGMGFGFGGRR